MPSKKKKPVKKVVKKSVKKPVKKVVKKATKQLKATKANREQELKTIIEETPINQKPFHDTIREARKNIEREIKRLADSARDSQPAAEPQSIFEKLAMFMVGLNIIPHSSLDSQIYQASSWGEEKVKNIIDYLTKTSVGKLPDELKKSLINEYDITIDPPDGRFFDGTFGRPQLFISQNMAKTLDKVIDLHDKTSSNKLQSKLVRHIFAEKKESAPTAADASKAINELLNWRKKQVEVGNLKIESDPELHAKTLVTNDEAPTVEKLEKEYSESVAEYLKARRKMLKAKKTLEREYSKELETDVNPLDILLPNEQTK